MGILRTIIWVFLTIVLVVFAMANWIPVTVRIWPGQDLETKLPMLIFIAFLLGSIPTWIALRATRWTLNRRLDNSERQLADLRAMASRPSDPAPPANPASTPVNDIPPSPLETP